MMLKIWLWNWIECMSTCRKL